MKKGFCLAELAVCMIALGIIVFCFHVGTWQILFSLKAWQQFFLYDLGYMVGTFFLLIVLGLLALSFSG